MGVLQVAASHPLVQEFRAQGIMSQAVMLVGGLLVLSVALNVAKQLLFRNKNEPPMVFHWFPFIGSTVTYGMDPPKFFQENRKKVRNEDIGQILAVESC